MARMKKRMPTKHTNDGKRKIPIAASFAPFRAAVAGEGWCLLGNNDRIQLQTNNHTLEKRQ
jgi:hypothetical protein